MDIGSTNTGSHFLVFFCWVRAANFLFFGFGAVLPYYENTLLLLVLLMRLQFLYFLSVAFPNSSLKG